MERTEFESQFLEYIDGNLSSTERSALENALRSDQELGESLNDYKALLKIEDELRAESDGSLGDNLESLVMRKIARDNRGDWRQWLLALRPTASIGIGILAVFLVLRNDLDLTDRPIAKTPLSSIPHNETHEASGPTIAQAIGFKDARSGASKVDREQLAIVNRSFEERDGLSTTGSSFHDMKGATQTDQIGRFSEAPNSLRQDNSKSKYFTDLKKSYAVSADTFVGVPRIASRDESAYFSHYGCMYPHQIGCPFPREPWRYFPQPYIPPTPTPGSGDHYVSSGENDRLSVAEAPLSTFSLDVDTASYANMRRFVLSRQLPPRDSVRVEDFVNYFDYNYPSQKGDLFTVSYEIAPAPLDSGRHLLKLGIKARDSEFRETPWNLVFLIDVSGSMASEDKLELIKKALRILVNNMRSEDRIGIVTYAGAAGIHLEPSTVANRSRILSAIDSLRAGGNTNGSGGLDLAYRVAETHKRSAAVNRVIIASDGDFNVGITSREKLTKIIEEKRRSGITLTALGVGRGNLNDAMLEQIANKGNGSYFYLDSLKEARRVMEEQIASTIEVVAKDVKLQIEFNPQHVREYRLIGYDNRTLQNSDFHDDQADAGEIGVGHTVTALYEVVLAGSRVPETIEYRFRQTPSPTPEYNNDHESELAFLKMRYKEPYGSQSNLLEFPINASAVRSSGENTSDDFRFAAAVAYYAQKIREGKFSASYSMQEIRRLAESGRGLDESGQRREFIDLVKDTAILRGE